MIVDAQPSNLIFPLLAGDWIGRLAAGTDLSGLNPADAINAAAGLGTAGMGQAPEAIEGR